MWLPCASYLNIFHARYSRRPTRRCQGTLLTREMQQISTGSAGKAAISRTSLAGIPSEPIKTLAVPRTPFAVTNSRTFGERMGLCSRQRDRVPSRATRAHSLAAVGKNTDRPEKGNVCQRAPPIVAVTSFAAAVASSEFHRAFLFRHLLWSRTHSMPAALVSQVAAILDALGSASMDDGY